MAKSSTFDYTAAIAAVCKDICANVPELRHIDMSRVAVGFAQTKNITPFGFFATTTPLRFENGEIFKQSQGRKWKAQRHVQPDGTESLYILRFYVPRFIDLPLHRKLDTIVHELYHINPLFNGDIRWFDGCPHGSKKQYNQTVKKLVQCWLKQDPPRGIWEFLECDFQELCAKYGKPIGTRIPRPKIIPVSITGDLP